MKLYLLVIKEGNITQYYEILFRSLYSAVNIALDIQDENSDITTEIIELYFGSYE